MLLVVNNKNERHLALCLLSDKTERRGLSGLRTSSRRKTEEFIIRYSRLKISDMPRGAFKALRPCAA